VAEAVHQQLNPQEQVELAKVAESLIEYEN
jgi:hypothetical protein